MPPTNETAASRSASVQSLMNSPQLVGETSDVKAAALNAMAAPVPAPSRRAADVVWVVLVGGLVLVLVLALLGLTHVLGGTVSDDKLITIFTAVLAGLLGLFSKAPGSS